jgi:hypothetical protein
MPRGLQQRHGARSGKFASSRKVMP